MGLKLRVGIGSLKRCRLTILHSYGFMIERTADGRAFRTLNIIDEYTRKCLAILVKRRITSQDVSDQLFELFIFRGIPEHLRSGNDREFTVKAIRAWLNRIGVKMPFIERGSPWENGQLSRLTAS